MSEQPTKKTRSLQQENWASESKCKKNFFQINVDNKVHCLLRPVEINIVGSVVN